MLSLSSSANVPLYQQVYSQIREAILRGRLRPGERLTSTRDLAASHRISRNTVNLAYERLLSEGYLESKCGSGTYVTTRLPAYSATKREERHGNGESIALTRWSTDLESWVYVPPFLASPLPYDFRPGKPTLEHFPVAIWRRIVGRHLRCLSPDLAGYDRPAGYPPLREAIAVHLSRSRAVMCHADQIVVTTGSQQALDLLARLLVSRGQRVILENPCYPAAVAVFRAAQAKISPVPVDSQGIQIDRLPQGGRLLYVTPSHQFPSGVLLPLSRRLALLNWAQKHRTIIIEDDYDSEFRYGDRPVESFQGLDQSGMVIYLGTFSKVLFPTLRVGYVVLPPALVKPFSALKWICDRHTTGLQQRLLADFMVEGYFDRHLRKMRNVYAERRDALLESLEHYAKDYIEVAPSTVGLHITGWIKCRVDMALLRTRAAELGVGIYPLTPYFLQKPRPGLIFGFAISVENIRTGIQRLGEVLARLIS